jgi:hypothetical protein
MINESDIAKAFDKLHQASQDRTWIEARLGKKLTTTPTYLLRVPGTTNQFYVSLGRNGDQGVTTAVDLIGVAEKNWMQVRLRRENERLVIREATESAAGNSGPTLLDDLADVSFTGLLNGQTLAYDAINHLWINATPSGGGSGMIQHDLDSNIYHSGTLSWDKVNKTGSTLASLGTHSHGELTGISPDQHHPRLHNITDPIHHSVVGAQYDVIGLTATNALGILASSSNPGATQKVLRTDANGGFIIGSGLFAVSPNTNKVTMDSTMFVFDNLTNIITLGAKAIFNDDATFNDPTTFNDNVTFTADIIRFNKDPQLYANLDFRSGDRSITADNSLHIKPSTDLWLESEPVGYVVGGAVARGLVQLPDDQVIRSATFTPLITGIEGWIIDLGPGTYHQLSINSILTDNLFAKKFTADEARVQRGETFLTRSYGTVETSFTLPTLTNDRDVWFEEAPGMGNFKLFVPGNWLQSRTIDWGTGLVIQAVWFKVVDAGANDWVDREPQSGDTPARQKWRIKRMLGGYDGATISKGEQLADVGIPRNTSDPNDFGQGQIWSTSLYEPDRGPFVQVQTFEDVIGGAPHFIPRVRMGNLQNTVDFTQPAWGFVAGNNVGTSPSAGFSGVAIDAKQGARLFNTDIYIYDAGIKAAILHRDYGLAFHYDTDYSDWNDLRAISWVENLNSPGNPGDASVSSISSFSGEDPTHYNTRGIKINVQKATGITEQTAIYLEAGNSFASTDQTAYLNILGFSPMEDGTTKSQILSGAVEFHHQGNLRVYNTSTGPPGVAGALFAVNRSQLNIVDVRGITGKSGGIVIEQQGGAFDSVFGGGPQGEAAIHWRMRSRESQWFNPGAPLDHWYSMGISNISGFWKLTAHDSLQSNDIIVYDPSTGTVTIHGWSPGGSSPPSGLIAGSGISLTGSTISVNNTVARNTHTVNAGDGLVGGGSLTANPTLSVLLQANSGLINGPTGIAISSALAGTGLTMSASKVLSINPASYVPPTRLINTTLPISGGHSLATDVTLGLVLATTEPGLQITDGLTVDGSVVRTTMTIVTGANSGLQGGHAFTVPVDLSIKLKPATTGLSTTGGLFIDSSIARSNVTVTATAPLNGGGTLASNFSIGLTLAPNSGLDTTAGLNIPLSIAGYGLLMSGAKVLTVNTAEIVPVGRTITPVAPLIGGGDLSGNRSISLDIATPSGLTIAGGKLAISDSLAGTGLIMNASKQLMVDSSALVPGSRTVTAGQGMTGGGALSADITLDVVAGDGTLLVSANSMKVDQTFTFSWSGLHTFGAGATFNAGTFQFNTAPQISANLNFIAADRSITASNSLLISPTGSLTLSPVAKNVYPESTLLTNLGGQARKWNTIYAAELYVEALVASNVMATIGGRVMVTNTNVLLQDLTTSTATFLLKYNDPAFKEYTFILLEDFVGGVPWSEIMRIWVPPVWIPGSGLQVTVLRNQKAGGTARAWLAGTAVASLGTDPASGWIDLSSVATAYDHVGPTITIYTRLPNPTDLLSQTWNNVAPVATMGNLKGFVDVVTDKFGFAAGNDLTKSPTTGFSGIVVDQTSLRMFNTILSFYSSGTKITSLGDKSGLLFAYDTFSATAGERGVYWTSGSLPTLTNVSKVNAYRDVNGDHLSVYASNSGAADVTVMASNTLNTHSSYIYITEDSVYTYLRNDYQVISSQTNRYSFGVTPSVAPASTMHIYENTTVNSNATGVTIENFNTTGDSMLHFVHANGPVQRWVLGVDRSNSNAFNIGQVAGFASPNLTILPTGFVGIGTNNPGALLVVEKNQDAATLVSVRNTNTGTGAFAYFNFTADTAYGLLGATSSTFTTSGVRHNNQVELGAYGGSELLLRTTAGAIVLATDSAEAGRVDRSGNLLLGATTVHASNPKLHVFRSMPTTTGGDDYAAYIQANGGGASGARNQTVLFLYSNPGGSGVANIVETGLDIHIRGSQSVGRARAIHSDNGDLVLDTGRIGIGNGGLVPQSQLEVYSSIVPANFYRSTPGITNTQRAIAQFYAQSDVNIVDNYGPYVTFGISDDTVGNTEIARIGAERQGADNSGKINFWTSLAGVSSRAMTVDKDNQVGIGNQSPSAFLHIGPNTPTLNTYSGSGIYIAPATTNVAIAMRSTTPVEAGMFIHSSNNFYHGTWTNHAMILRTNNLDRLTIGANGGSTFSAALIVAGLLTANSGVNLGDTTLSTYLEGTWSPTLTSDTTVTVTYSARSGSYIRVNNMIMFSAFLTVGTVTTPGSGNLRVSMPLSSTVANQGGGCIFNPGGAVSPGAWNLASGQTYVRITQGGGYYPANSTNVFVGLSISYSGVYLLS